MQRWVRLSSETFQNAGAIGDVDGDGRLEVVTGTGADYCRNTDPTPARCLESRKVWAFHLDDGSDVPGWPKLASYTTFLSAPALGDIDGDGKTDVVVGSTDYNPNPPRGAIDAFLGNGRTAHRDYTDEIIASPVIADVNGQAPSEVIVGNSHVEILNGSLSRRRDATWPAPARPRPQERRRGGRARARPLGPGQRRVRPRRRQQGLRLRLRHPHPDGHALAPVPQERLPPRRRPVRTPTPAPAATGWWQPTAASSASATPPSTAPPATSG